MRLPTFDHHAPKSFQELVKINGDLGGPAVIMAGGIEDLVLNLKKPAISQSTITGLTNIDDLQRLEPIGDPIVI